MVRDPFRSSEAQPFYTFEVLTLCPIDVRLLNKAILTNDEVHWLNAYHQRVRKELTPLLAKEAAAWLRRATRPI